MIKKDKIWVHKAKSFEEAEAFDKEYYRKMKASERLETMQLLREMYFKMKRGPKNAGRKRLRRVIRVIQQK